MDSLSLINLFSCTRNQKKNSSTWQIRLTRVLIVGQMPIKAGWWDASFVLWDYSHAEATCIASTSLQQRQSISLVMLLTCPHFRSSHPESSGVAGVFSGTNIFCKLCEILKNTFFTEYLQWLFLAFAPIEISYPNTVCKKSAAEAWVCLVSFSMVKNGVAKEFLFACIFLTMITFFIKI